MRKRIVDDIVRRQRLAGTSINDSYIDEVHLWSNSSLPPPPTVNDYYGPVRINIDPPKVKKAMATKKFVATLVIEENSTDKYQNGVKVNLMQIQLTDDDLAEVLRKAHGHLDLVPDGKQESGARGVSA